MCPLAERSSVAVRGSCIAACVAALPYLQTVWFGFVNYDDPLHVTENPAFFPVSWSSLATLWMRPYHHLYVPASYMLFAAECVASRWLHGNGPTAAVSPWVFHAVSIVLHVLSALLVVRILRRFTSLPWAAAAGGIVFAAHPLQVESVAWVAEQRGLLAAVFSLLAIDQFLAWVDQDRARSLLQPSYLVATGALVVALLAKPSAIVTPFLAFAVAFHRRSVPWHTLAKPLVPWAGLALAAAIVTRTVQPAELSRVDVPFLYRPLIAGDALAFYAGKIVAPTGLCVAYGRTPQVTVADAAAPFLAGLVAIAFAALLLSRAGRAWRLPLVLFVIPLVPVLGFTPFAFQNHSTVADRYVYLAMLGPALAITVGIDRWHRARSTLLGGGLPLAATVAITVVCLPLTWRQAGVWRDSLTLFSHSLATGHDSPVARTQLGLALSEMGRPGDALPHLQRALEAQPWNDGAMLNLAAILITKNDPDSLAEAKRLLAHIGDAERYAKKININLGRIAKAEGRYAEALAAIDAALGFPPAKPATLADRGYVLWKLGRLPEALADLDTAIGLDEEIAPAWLNRGNVLMDLERPQEAERSFARSVDVDPLYSKGWDQLGISRQARGDRAAALEAFNRAVTLDPKDAEAVYNRGNLLADTGRVAEAITDYCRAIEIDPKLAGAWFNRAVLRLQRGEIAAAKADFHAFSRLGGELPPAVIAALSAADPESTGPSEPAALQGDE